MTNAENIKSITEALIAKSSEEDFISGNIYGSTQNFCSDYDDYQLSCDIIDCAGAALGIDEIILSENRASFEAAFYWFDTLYHRMGRYSPRIIVSKNNAAPIVEFAELKINKLQSLYQMPMMYNYYNQEVHVYISEKKPDEVVCLTPIFPISIMINERNNTETIYLTYYSHDQWGFDKVTPGQLSDRKYIKSLVDRGVYIPTSSYKLFADYMLQLIHLNRGDAIKVLNATDKIGWHNYAGLKEFVPYSQFVCYCGKYENSKMYNAIKDCKGDLTVWIDTVNTFRKNGHIPARIVLAASFASVLVKLLDNQQCFAVNIWGGESGSGKSVTLLTAASVWGDPHPDHGYIKKVDNTYLGNEKYVAFCNHLPAFLDETQTVKNRSIFDQWVYNLCSGIGRAASTPDGKYREEENWANCILFTGEEPMLKRNSKAGSLNRLIEIPAPDRMLFTKKKEYTAHIKNIVENYGVAGRAFIDCFARKGRVEKAGRIFSQYVEELENKAANKQVSSAALILTADELASEYVFKDKIKLKVDDILPFLRTDVEVNTNVRAHEMIIDWITANSGKFANKDNRWGKFNSHDGRPTCDIIYEQLSEYLQKKNLSIESYMKWAKTAGHIYCDKDGHTKVKVWFDGPNGERTRPRCVCVYYEDTNPSDDA